MTNNVATQLDVQVYDYLRQPYARIIIPEDDGSFRGEIMEFPGCISSGDDPSETLRSLEGVAMAWLTAALENGQSIPDPVELSSDFSGRFVLRIPKSLHKKATWYAEREGVSLNQFISYSLAESVGERRAPAAVFVAVYSTATPAQIKSSSLQTANWAPTWFSGNGPYFRAIGGPDARSK
jgi:antitoxin HicB